MSLFCGYINLILYRRNGGGDGEVDFTVAFRDRNIRTFGQENCWVTMKIIAAHLSAVKIEPSPVKLSD